MMQAGVFKPYDISKIDELMETTKEKWVVSATESSKTSVQQTNSRSRPIHFRREIVSHASPSNSSWSRADHLESECERSLIATVL